MLDAIRAPGVTRDLLDALPVGVMVVDREGAIRYCNDHARSIFRANVDQLARVTVEALVPQPERAAHVSLRRGFQANPSERPMGYGRHLRGLRLDGSTFMVEVALAPAPGDGDDTLVVVRDVTDRVESEEAERQSFTSSALAADRMRIARDLHDHVIQNLFAAGLTLSGMMSGGDGADRDSVDKVIDVIDDSIRRLRAAIFQLHARDDDADLQPIVDEASHVLGFRPRLVVNGDLRALDQHVRSDVMAVVRESLSNVARHAAATRASVEVDVGDTQITVSVSDNGIGLTSSAVGRGTGLRSLEERALHHGGRARFEAEPDGGTLVTWQVPRSGGQGAERH